jgi:K+-sensing histidine kinase KdpD
VVADDGEVTTLIFFLLMAALTGKLAARMQGEMARNQEMVQRLTNINQITRLMTSGPDAEAVQHALARHMAETFTVSAWVVLQKEGDEALVHGHQAGHPIPPPDAAALRQLQTTAVDGRVGSWYRLAPHLPHCRTVFLSVSISCILKTLTG